MEEYRNKVVNLHAILSQDYQQIGNISKTTSKFTSKSGRRRFYPGSSSSFRGDQRGSELLTPQLRMLMTISSPQCITGQPLLSPP